MAAVGASGDGRRCSPPGATRSGEGVCASRGTRAKTDRIDAELIARFFAFRREADRSLSAENLRLLKALTSKRAQLVEMRKRLLAQIRADQNLGIAVMFEDVDSELKHRIESLIKELEDRITGAIASADRLSETAGILRSIPGICPVASTMLIAEMPEIGTITGEQAAALTGLAPVAHDSGTIRGQRAIAGGRTPRQKRGSFRGARLRRRPDVSDPGGSCICWGPSRRDGPQQDRTLVTGLARSCTGEACTRCRGAGAAWHWPPSSGA